MWIIVSWNGETNYLDRIHAHRSVMMLCCTNVSYNFLRSRRKDTCFGLQYVYNSHENVVSAYQIRQEEEQFSKELIMTYPLTSTSPTSRGYCSSLHL